MNKLVLALVLVGQVHSYTPRLSPPLHDGGDLSHGEQQSDKKFFGPPFPADYPEDKRPVPDQKIMDKLKSKDQPYPALQAAKDYDADYVKDENSDTGAWAAQFEYDSLRKKLAQEEADAKRAAAEAARERAEMTDAERAAADAAKKVSDASKDDLDAINGEEKAKTADDFGGPPSAEKLEELKKAVKAAEEKLEQQKKAFEKCKQELEDAKKTLADLKVAQAETEKQLAADTKLWAEKKAVKLNLKKTRESEAVAKVVAAKAKLAAAQKVKADLDLALAKEKAEHVAAQKQLAEKQAHLDNAKKQLGEAATKLQKLHGYKPADTVPAKSNAAMASAVVSILLAVRLL